MSEAVLHTAAGVGILFGLVTGLASLLLLLVTLCWALRSCSRELWLRMREIYSITVCHYWLRRLEREGLRCFEKARKGAPE